MRRRTRLLQADEDPQINLTSLIDVVFVILILFILVAPILELDRIQLPSAGDAKDAVSVKEAGPISIHVHKNNQIYFNQNLVSLPELADRLRLAKRSYPTAAPQLFCDEAACFGTYQMIKNATQAAGFEELDVILKPS